MVGPLFGSEVTRVVPLHKETKGSRVHVRATLGAKVLVVFHIDVVVAVGQKWRACRSCPLMPLHNDGLACG